MKVKSIIQLFLYDFKRDFPRSERASYTNKKNIEKES